MAAPRFAWGIDIGNRALKAVKLVPDGAGSYRVDDFALIEYETVLSNAGDNREPYVQAALNQLVNDHNLRGGAAAIGVSGQSSFARFIKLPPVEPKKIPEIVRFEAIQQIPFPLEDVEWSYQLFQDPTNPDVEVGIFAMRKELVNQQIQQFTELDVDVQVVQMNPLAVYNAMRFDNRLDGATMIIDLGAENADLIICEGDGIWMRSIPIGGNNFTEALVKAFKVNFQKAEDLKRNAATSKYQRQIFQAMRPVFSDLVSEIQRSIGFYASVHRDSRISRIIATGGTFRLPTLQKYLQQNLQVPVDRVEALAAAPPADPKSALAFNESILSMPAAYGLALQAMGEGQITSSLLPESIRKSRMWKEKNKWFATAAALFLGGAGIALASTYITSATVRSAKAEFDADPQVAGVIQQAKENDQAWGVVESAGAEDRVLIANVRSLAKGRQFWPTLLADLDAAAAATDPQPELYSGDPAQIKSIPRDQRRQIVIHKVTSEYRPDMTPLINAAATDFITVATGAAPAAGPAFDPMTGASTTAEPAVGEARRGFLVTLKMTTPNAQGYQFVYNTLLKALLSIDQSVGQERGYYVAQAGIIEATQGVSPDVVAGVSPRSSAPRLATTGGGRTRAAAPIGRPGGGGPPNIADSLKDAPAFIREAVLADIAKRGGIPTGARPGAGGTTGGAAAGSIPGRPVGPQVTADTAARDPLTDEPMAGDYSVTLIFAVVLDPPPPAPADPTAQPSAAAR